MEECPFVSGQSSQDVYMETTSSNESAFNGMTITDGHFFKVVAEKCTSSQTIAVCLKCQPNTIEIKGNAKSSSNFLCHLKRKHGQEAVEEYNTYLKEKRKCTNEINITRQIKKCIRKNKISQEDFEDNMLKFVLHSMVPLRIVDDPFFKNIFMELDISSKGLKMINSGSLSRKMDILFRSNVQCLKDTLKNVQYVSTTVDIWSGHQISFLVITVHWIKENFQRGSAALACRKFPSSHAHERIMELINEIHNDYGLYSAKIRATITDNANNFLKAIREYGVEVKCVEVVEDLNFGESDSHESERELEEDSLSSGFSLTFKTEQCLQNLPLNHIECCARTLNVCASADMSKVISSSENLSVGLLHKQVISKCNMLWRAVSHSKSSEVLQDILGHSLTRPDETRWNSLYDALKKILDMKDKCAQVFQALELKDSITVDEFIYIEEHLDCVKPVAEALDILQEEKHAYYGAVLPVLFALLPKLENLNVRQWRFSKPISECLLNSVRHRFQDLFTFSTSESLNAALAALSHPQFKNRWLTRVSTENQNKIMKLFKEAVAAESILVVEDIKQEIRGSSAAASHFFDFGEEKKPPPNEQATEIQVLQFLTDNSQILNMLDFYPEIKKVFLKYNTPLPSSALVERFFSYATITNLLKSNELNDKNFEIRVLMKANSYLMFDLLDNKL